jgi:HK97 family phage major capsid protein
MNLPALTKAQVGQVAMVMRGQIEGINSQGGALVPAEVENLVIARRNVVGVIRRNARPAYMGSDVMVTPRRTTDVVAGYLVEGQSLPESTQAFDSIALVAKKLGAITRTSSELDEDQITEEATDFVGMLGYALALQEDKTGFVGDGTSAHAGQRGIVNLLGDSNHSAGRVSAASGHGTFGALTADDLGQLVGLLPSWATLGAKWYVSPFGYAAAFARLGATAGSNVGPNGRPYLSYLGFPVEISDQLPGNASISSKVAVLFGDMSLAATLGTRRGITIKRLDERYSEYDQVGWTVTERIHFIAHDLGDGSNPGGVVALLGN